MNIVNKTLTFGLIVGTRGFFNPRLADEGRRQLHLCQEGFEHHVAMARTHFAEALREATEKYMKWDLYHHK